MTQREPHWANEAETLWEARDREREARMVQVEDDDARMNAHPRTGDDFNQED